MKFKVLGVVTAVALATPVYAFTVPTGSMWLDWCNLRAAGPLKERAVAYGLCVGFADGLRNGFEVWRQYAVKYGHNNPYICIPYNVDNDQLVDVGKRFIERRPERRHEDVTTLLMEAFVIAWPCEAGGTLKKNFVPPNPPPLGNRK
jgi:hypothetical protein